LSSHPSRDEGKTSIPRRRPLVPLSVRNAAVGRRLVWMFPGALAAELALRPVGAISSRAVQRLRGARELRCDSVYGGGPTVWQAVCSVHELFAVVAHALGWVSHGPRAVMSRRWVRFARFCDLAVPRQPPGWLWATTSSLSVVWVRCHANPRPQRPLCVPVPRPPQRCPGDCAAWPIWLPLPALAGYGRRCGSGTSRFIDFGQGPPDAALSAFPGATMQVEAGGLSWPWHVRCRRARVLAPVIALERASCSWGRWCSHTADPITRVGQPARAGSSVPGTCGNCGRSAGRGVADFQRIGDEAHTAATDLGGQCSPDTGSTVDACRCRAHQPPRPDWEAAGRPHDDSIVLRALLARCVTSC